MCEDWCMWIFGYGSLCWRPGFPYVRKVVGYVKGYKRRFWQGSTDHRGVPGAPGRVVTMVRPGPHEGDAWPDDDVTWGVAYCVMEHSVHNVIGGLDYREKGGYKREQMDVFTTSNDVPSIRGAIVYMATEDNEEYLGPAPVETMALQMATAVGPSGPNVDYLFALADFMRLIGKEDHHVFQLESRVREIQTELEAEEVNLLNNNNNNNTAPHSQPHPHPHPHPHSHTHLHVHPHQHPHQHPHPHSHQPGGSFRPLRLSRENTKNISGVLVVDPGAAMAVSQRRKPLRAVGVLRIEGSFPRNSLVAIRDSAGSEVSRGFVNFSSDQMNRIVGKQSSEFSTVLTPVNSAPEFPDAVVDAHRLILL